MKRDGWVAACSAVTIAAALLACGADGERGAGGAYDAGGDARFVVDADGVFRDASELFDGGGGLVPLVFPAHPPDFPAHFSSVTPPAMVARLDDLCAIDTGSASSVPSVTLCPKGGAPLVSSPPNLMVVDAQNATVLWVASLDITHAVKVSGARALAIVSAGELALDAPIDLSARGASAGPGARDVGAGVGSVSPCDGGAAGASAGAGFGGDGGAAPGVSGGAFYGGDAGMFVGGSRGGGACVTGGGGGGALQLSSATSLLVLPAGSLRAAGGGGTGGAGSSAGGGSGGEIFLESLAAFLVSTDVSANGGGGGGAGIMNGSDGRTSQTPASGGFAGDGGANGGRGGVAAIAPTDGVADITNTSLNGGGGGAAGRIWLRSLKVPTGTPSFSPAPVVLTF